MRNIHVLLVFLLIFLQDHLPQSAGSSSRGRGSIPEYATRQEAYDTLVRLHTTRERVDQMISNGEIVILDELRRGVPGGTPPSSRHPQETEYERFLRDSYEQQQIYRMIGLRYPPRGWNNRPNSGGPSHSDTMHGGENVGLALTGYGNTFMIHTVPINNDSESRSPRNSSQEHAPNVSATSDEDYRFERGYRPHNETPAQELQRRRERNRRREAGERVRQSTPRIRIPQIGRDTGGPSTVRMPGDRVLRRGNYRADNFPDRYGSSDDD